MNEKKKKMSPSLSRVSPQSSPSLRGVPEPSIEHVFSTSAKSLSPLFPSSMSCVRPLSEKTTESVHSVASDWPSHGSLLLVISKNVPTFSFFSDFEAVKSRSFPQFSLQQKKAKGTPSLTSSVFVLAIIYEKKPKGFKRFCTNEKSC